MPRPSWLTQFARSLVVVAAVAAPAFAQTDWSIKDRSLAEYFRAEVSKLAVQCQAQLTSPADWVARRDEARRQLLEMLGLDPLPPRTDLKSVITGTVEHPQFVVERMHFQSLPGLYVTGNLYLPKNPTSKLPAILYVCGHGRVVKDGVSLGNKTSYQHHGGWFARNGYVCLTIDTIQLGEIEGIHHGTYGVRKGDAYEHMWWWPCRGYTPAGVEAWNCIRALDYLQSRPEVDGERIGVTGRSGGGAYSWWIAAIDERIKAAVPVAGITDLENHVVDGCVEGHCDCMYMLNTYRWDFAQVAALVAPRPLLISNTDKDPIFPLEGVVRLHRQVREVYKHYGKPENLGLQITEGPHKDTQELHIHAFRWFNRFLKNDDAQIETAAVKLFEPEQLKVFDKLPQDQIVTNIHETFVPQAQPKLPDDDAHWESMRQALLAALKDKVFRGWPQAASPVPPALAFSAEREGVRLAAYDFVSQEHVPLRLYLAHRAGPANFDLVVLNVLDEDDGRDFLASYLPAFGEELKPLAGDVQPSAEKFKATAGMFSSFPWAMAYLAPRGIGPAAWPGNERKQTQIQRRFMLLGQSLDGMRVWDVRQAAQALRSLPELQDKPLWMAASRQMAGVALYAALFVPSVARLDLHSPTQSHRDGPYFLNVLRYLDMPQAVALAAQNTRVVIYQDRPGGWEYPAGVIQKLRWDAKQLEVRSEEAK